MARIEFLDFEIEMDHQIPAWRPDQVITNKKKTKKTVTCHLGNFAVPADHKVKKN